MRHDGRSENSNSDSECLSFGLGSWNESSSNRLPVRLCPDDVDHEANGNGSYQSDDNGFKFTKAKFHERKDCQDI